MNRTTIGTARRFALTLTVAGAAALGSIAIAPAASAAPLADGTNMLIEGAGNGPDAFILTSTGRIPVFFCEDVQPGKDGVVDQKEYAARLAKAEAQAAPYTRAAALLRQAATALRTQALSLNHGQAKKALALAEASDLAASKLEAQAQALIAKVGGIGCIVVTAPGGRF